ncbi:tetratricopeptide repeat protein [Halopiger goleimassiliensis]|uniref:tetratricopeptide repeat protein n=1 Tax=Halopiger goleimassiliensis TaxID=1293048 RepID=UPI000677FA5D|nr:tetratricopeptide repeat protein [Halopiger goleimassiliensis]
MAERESHQYSSGQGFEDPYEGFDLEFELPEDGTGDPEARRPMLSLSPDEIDPVDTRVLPDLLDEAHVPTEQVDADALIDVGLEYVGINRHEQAADAFERAARFADDPEREQEAWVNKGIAHAELEEWDAAAGAHREALSVLEDGPFAAEAHTNLAYALWERGEDERAFQHAEDAVRANPRLGQAWYNIGFMELERGRPELARECLDNAVRLGYRTVTVHEERARALEELGEDAAAAAERDRAESIREDLEQRMVADGPGPQ